jgi:hypothetical protein
MDADLRRELLAKADQSIAKARSFVARQNIVVEQLRERGEPTLYAEAGLETAEESLRIFEAMRNRLRDRF